MTQLEVVSASDAPVAIGASFAEVLALGPAEQVELFRRAHRRAVSGRYAEVVTLTAIEESRAYEAAGCSSAQQFAARIGDYTQRDVRDLLRIGRALRQCPELDAAFRTGRLSWSKVRTLIPVVTSETAAGWIEKATHVSTAMLERMVGRQREPEGMPGMAPMPEVAIGVLVAFRELCARVRQRLRKPGMPDGECAGVLFAMAGWAFEQHADEALGVLGYPDAVPAAAAREEVPAESTRGEPVGDVAEESGKRTARSEASTSDEGVSDDAMTHVGHGHWSDQLITGVATPVLDAMPPFNHSRHIPDAVRRSVLARAGYRCEAPGCANPHAIDLHHLIPFAHGGPHIAENFRVWCRRCHELWHRSHPEEPDES